MWILSRSSWAVLHLLDGRTRRSAVEVGARLTRDVGERVGHVFVGDAARGRRDFGWADADVVVELDLRLTTVLEEDHLGLDRDRRILDCLDVSTKFVGRVFALAFARIVIADRHAAHFE